MDCLEISGCSNTNIFCAAVARVCSLTTCENVTLTVAASVLRVGNCIDCSVHSYTHMGPPVVFGDTRSLTMAPHNAGYPELKDHLMKAGLNVTTENVVTRVQNFGKPILMHVAR